MKNLIYYLIGTSDYYQFFVGLFFLFLGIAVSILLHANTRDIHSSRTPLHFSYKVLFSDNSKRIMLSVLLSLIAYRFADNFFEIKDNMYLAFLIGFSFDKTAQVFKDRFKVLK
ncbi:MAG: hypothetical protein L3J56_06365 [Bacteroidales bacterium]|nr:hypothetical protein [Bacteroidales bacterium]